TQADIDTGEVMNTAEVFGNPPDGDPNDPGDDVTDTDDHVEPITPAPSIEIEKSTNGVDADAPEDAPEIAPGDTVTWTYKVTNTGNVSFAENEIQVTDDQEGTITNIINKGDGDDTLAPDEMWTYQKTGTAQNLTGSGGQTQTFNLTGNSGLDGQDGNIRTFTAGDVSVKASAFSRTNSGNWSEAFLGAFSSGLGVTDTSEGNGGNDRHKVDNVGRDNYILFEFSEDVVIDRTFLDSVGADSDITYWVGSKTDAFNNHNTLDDGFLNSLEFTQDNNGESSSRWANINNQQVAGNVLVIAASTSDNTPDDRFKVKKLEFQQVESGIYQNIGTVVADGVNDSDPSHYVNGEPDPQNPGIEIEKSTNGVDADAPEDAPEIAPGDTVTWTYKVTNTGNVSFAENEIQVTDDQEGTITNIINKGDGDDTLAPDEMWTYQKTGTAQNLTGSGGQTQTFNLTGNSGLDGQDGNIRTFTAGDVSVKASAFSRTNSGNWSEAFLGAFSSGLGVTDTSEGNGGNDRHKVDNVGRDNYILFEFSEDVVIDRTFLDSVGADSDITYWVGSKTDAFNNHNTLDDGFLNSLEFTQDNNGESSSRWANINNQQVAGNVLVIAASTSDNTPDDRFKVKKLEFQQVESGIYQNIGTVVADGVNDSDPSHYVNGEPDPQ
ncbi:hypothetical protein, partial [Okeania sp. SIO2G5]|uniref:DUF7507 domain-containing protein n=1 Tax=Okeania sp. SIO2G5 TaxID=2607796 RepID=UPI0013BF4CC4